jgi:L-ribulose-5-phosphate 3-epimerase
MAVSRGATGGGRTVAVCSWSLQARTARELATRVRETGVRAVQLALDPLRTGAMPFAEVTTAFGEAGITVVSGMMTMAGEDYSTLESIRRTGGVRPDATWAANREAAAENARVARALGIGLVTFHAGFLPHDPADPERHVLLERLQNMADAFAAEGVAVALETGQESAGTLRALLQALGRSDVGVNFDPANMILYGMGDPVSALRELAPYVRQIHIKDALPAADAGEWGTEVPVGEGAVDWGAFFTAVRETRIDADLVIEREAGSARVADVQRAAALIGRAWPAQAGAS